MSLKIYKVTLTIAQTTEHFHGHHYTNYRSTGISTSQKTFHANIEARSEAELNQIINDITPGLLEKLGNQKSENSNRGTSFSDRLRDISIIRKKTKLVGRVQESWLDRFLSLFSRTSKSITFYQTK